MTTTVKSMADDVASYFIAENEGSLPSRGGDLYVNVPPKMKSNFVLISDTGGAQSEQYYPLHHPSVQVAVYGDNHAVTYARAMRLYLLLNRKQNIAIGTRDAMYSRPVAHPQVIGLDPEKKRWLITFNVMFKIRGTDGE